MGWNIGYDEKHKRDIGYGVPAVCDHPDCNNEIDRGLAYVCGSEPYGGEHGCGLYFCDEHLHISNLDRNPQVCERCLNNENEFEPKPDTKEWNDYKLNHGSWEQWRKENPEIVTSLKS
ncbi:MAG TPA: hypothetical protein VLA13_07010 [Massilibacterium sp.]|nr:hypothetical protein [Massilibacterium sp.]